MENWVNGESVYIHVCIFIHIWGRKKKRAIEILSDALRCLVSFSGSDSGVMQAKNIEISRRLGLIDSQTNATSPLSQ